MMPLSSRFLPAVYAAAVALLVSSARVHAQSSSPMSIQLSGAGLVISGGLVPGAEAQVRYTAGRASLGGGYQFFTQNSARSDIVFVEPRLRLANTSRAAIYGAARIGVVTASSTAVFGGGGGFLFAAARGMSIDLGAQVYSADAKSVITQLRAGLSIGF